MSDDGRALADTLGAFARLSYERGPSYRELMADLTLSSESLVHWRVQVLVSRGLLEAVPVPATSKPGRSGYPNRGYRLTPAGREAAGASPEQEVEQA